MYMYMNVTACCLSIHMVNNFGELNSSLEVKVHVLNYTVHVSRLQHNKGRVNPDQQLHVCLAAKHAARNRS